MTKTTTIRRLLVLASTGLALLLIAAPIRAHEPRGHAHGHKKHHKHWKHARHHHPDIRYHAPRHLHHAPRYAVPKVLVVPRHIAVHEVARYRPYHYGTVWHAPHRHAHAVYHFPVRTDYGVAYRPHYYCEGELFVDSYIGYRGPRVSFNIRF